MNVTEDVKRATAAARRKAEAKRPETLDEAAARLSALKWNDAERAAFEDVIGALKSGEIRRSDDAKRLSKKEIVELGDVLREVRRQAKLDHLMRTKPDNYRIITDIAEYQEFIRDLYDDYGVVYFDTETTGLDLLADRIVGFSAWLNKGYGVYVPVRHTTGEKQIDADYAIQAIKEFLEDSQRKVVYQNAKYDLHMFANEGIDATQSLHADTMIASKLLNETLMSHSLKFLVTHYCGVESNTFDELFGSGEEPTIFDKPIGPAGVYAIKDTYYTKLLWEFFEPHLVARDGLNFVFREIEMPQIALSMSMERQGFALDIEACKALEAEFEVMVQEALESVYQEFGLRTPEFLASISKALGREITEFNVASSEQLAFLLYDHLQLPDISKSVNPKLQPKSTAAAVVEKLAEIDERIAPLLDYREKEKLLNTYVRKFPEMLGPDGRLHYALNQMGTDTGRYSSSQYGDKKNRRGVNIQQCPARSKAAKKVRALFIAG